MAKLNFEDLFFAEEGDGKHVRVVFLKNFYFFLPMTELMNIGHCVPQGHEIIFEGVSTKKAHKKLGVLLAKGFSNLKSALTDHTAVYVHQNSGIPLYGTLYFGVVDRGTNILEVKPITGCNIDCVFCSVFEGKSSKKLVDYVVEKDYLLSEVAGLLDFKRKNGLEEYLDDGKKIDVYINTHGEPLLYSDIVGLVTGLREFEEVGIISVITNGLLLNHKLIDDLAEAGLTQLNVSINSLDAEKAKKLSGSRIYEIEHVKKELRYAASKLKSDGSAGVVIAPVYIKGVNEEEMGGLISFAKEIGAEMGIQNYLRHKKGKKIARELGWKDFYNILEELEKKHNVGLVMQKHETFTTVQMPRPFKKGDVVKAEIKCPGRQKGEQLAVAAGRVISVLGCNRDHGMVKVEITRDKDGIFMGKKL